VDRRDMRAVGTILVRLHKGRIVPQSQCSFEGQDRAMAARLWELFLQKRGREVRRNKPLYSWLKVQVQNPRCLAYKLGVTAPRGSSLLG
jgi:hypothetical protein